MKLEIKREALLTPLQAIIGVVERKQTMPILANMLLQAKDNKLCLTATDLEVELMTQVAANIEIEGEITLPGRKLLDICRALQEDASIVISESSGKASVQSGRSRFSLGSLPATDFPLIDDIQSEQKISLPQKELLKLIQKTHFSMAQQDVRYYLNGLLLENKDGKIKAVATDGHRLAFCETNTETPESLDKQVIIPRKGVLELQRLLSGEGDLSIELGKNHVRIQVNDSIYTSKLIDGRFPEYDRVVPKDTSNMIQAKKEELKDALQRTAILSNEKYRGIRLFLSQNNLVLQAQNPEQEEAEESLEVEYTGDDIEIGFNVNYLLDALAVIESDEVVFSVIDGNSSCLMWEPGKDQYKFVIMPMRL
jgi:DNA polymerase-3 subunit beta